MLQQYMENEGLKSKGIISWIIITGMAVSILLKYIYVLMTLRVKAKEKRKVDSFIAIYYRIKGVLRKNSVT